MRGNVDTRLRKLTEGEADATYLALAGLKRLGLESKVTCLVDPQEAPPAPPEILSVFRTIVQLMSRADAPQTSPPPVA